MKNLLRKLFIAWNDKGPNPEYHDEQIRHLRIYWPTLFDIVMGLLTAYQEDKSEMTTIYLVWSMEHNCWWAPAHNGYVSKREEAGRYTYEQADEIVRGANEHCNPDRPKEAMIAI